MDLSGDLGVLDKGEPVVKPLLLVEEEMWLLDLGLVVEIV
jgi:hypothetical protein